MKYNAANLYDWEAMNLSVEIVNNLLATTDLRVIRRKTMKKRLIKEVLLAGGIGLAGGLAIATLATVFVLLRAGTFARAVAWGRAAAVIAGGFGLVYSGLLLFSEGNAWRDAFIFHFRSGKTKRTLEDELQPRDKDKKAVFTALPQKYVGLYASFGALVSSMFVEMVLFAIR